MSFGTAYARWLSPNSATHIQAMEFRVRWENFRLIGNYVGIDFENIFRMCSHAYLILIVIGSLTQPQASSIVNLKR